MFTKGSFCHSRHIICGKRTEVCEYLQEMAANFKTFSCDVNMTYEVPIQVIKIGVNKSYASVPLSSVIILSSTLGALLNFRGPFRSQVGSKMIITLSVILGDLLRSTFTHCRTLSNMVMEFWGHCTWYLPGTWVGRYRYPVPIHQVPQ